MMRNSFFRSGLGSLLAGLLLASVFVCGVTPRAHAQGADVPFPRAVQWLKWSNNIGSAVQVDSTYKQLNGAPATNHTFDTTAVFTPSVYVAEGASALSTTASGVARLFIRSFSGTIASVDTLLYIIQGSPDQTNWVILKSSTASLPATSGDRVQSVPILMDTDAAYDPFLFPYWRFIWRSDSASGATFPNAQCGISFLQRSSTR